MASEQNETGVLAGDERMLIDGELLADATLPRILARLEALAASQEG